MARAEKEETRPFTGRFTTRSLDALQRIADAEDHSVRWLIQRAIDAYIAARSKPARRKTANATEPAVPAALDDDALLT
ncbi:MAG: hypothetical protein WB985_12245 [Candidatus Acidiferrales bacterium]